ncbi:MAG: M28 family metallopeptidase, partial [Bacteroidota bacterium]
DEASIMEITATPANRSGRVRNTRSGIAVGVLRGTTGRIIVIGGHIDSASPEVPGTNDDGSGSAVVLELARVLAQREWRSTIVFCLFGGEESGLVGSRSFVRDFREIDSVDLMLQVDMANGVDDLIPFIDQGTTQTPSWLLRAAYEELSTLGHSGLSYPVHFFTWNIASGSGASSDHEPFLLKGIPAIDFTTDANDPIHTPQDSWEWFRPGGLERSGDLVYRLVERFDAGVPAERTGSYMTTQWGTGLLLLPTWSLWLFVVASIPLAVISYIFFRRGRTELRGTARPRKPGLKAAGGSLLVWVAVWGAENIVGLVTGWRSPWHAEPWWALLPAVVFGITASMVIGGLAHRWDMSRDPVRYALRSIAWFGLLVVVASLASPRLAAYFAAGLVLSSFAWHLRPAWLRLTLVLAGAYPAVRLLTPEVFPFIARGLSNIPAFGFFAEIALTLGLALASMIVSLPYIFAVIAVFRNPENRWPIDVSYRHPLAMGGAAVAAIISIVVAVQQVAYTDYRPRSVEINQEVKAGEDSVSTSISSTESLRDLAFVGARGDTTIPGPVYRSTMPPVPSDAGRWLQVTDAGWSTGDTGFTAGAMVRIDAAHRPYTLKVTYTSRRGKILSAEAGIFAVNRTSHTADVDLYSFPEVPLTLPVTLRLASADTVTELIEATFVEPASSVAVVGGPVNIEKRTTIRSTRRIPLPSSSPDP